MRGLWSAQILLAFVSPAIGQQAPLVMPSWLTPYPGGNVETKASLPARIEISYTTAAKPDEVIAHYQKLFEAAGLRFNPSFDGTGTSIRAAATECDLLIKVREQSAGTATRVSCAAKSAAPLSGAPVVVTNGSVTRTSSSVRFQESEEAAKFRAEQRKRMAEREAAHQRRTANMRNGTNEPVWPPGPENDAPALVWPSWLGQMTGGRPKPEQGVDQSRKRYLESKFVTSSPMTAVYNYYEDLLNANGYHVYSSKIGTGQTISGKFVQNADGYVEGAHYSYDNTGPHTVIHVSFRRSYLNEPITVRIRVTAYPRF